MSGCSSGKQRFRDELSAKMALANIGRQDRDQAREQRAYRCPSCKGWHLTSQPRNTKGSQS